MNGEPLSRLTDAELQARIDRFAALMLEAEERYKQRPYALEDRVERDRCWIAHRQCLLERGRRARIVARMEQERGLA